MKKFLLILIIAIALFSFVFFLKSSSLSSGFIWNLSKNGSWLFPLILTSALIDSVNPCAFSVLLLTIAFLISIGSLRSKIMSIGGFYILGIFLAYFLIGIGILQVLHLFNTPHFMAKLGAFLLIALGIINIINEFIPRFPFRLKIPQTAYGAIAGLMEKGSMPAAFLLGGLVGVCEFPCTGGPYLTALGLLHDSSAYFKGFFYLLFYNIIFILPLIIILALASNGQVMERIELWHNKNKKSMRLYGGAAMIVLGIIILAI